MEASTHNPIGPKAQPLLTTLSPLDNEILENIQQMRSSILNLSQEVQRAHDHIDRILSIINCSRKSIPPVNNTASTDMTSKVLDTISSNKRKRPSTSPNSLQNFPNISKRRCHSIDTEETEESEEAEVIEIPTIHEEKLPTFQLANLHFFSELNNLTTESILKIQCSEGRVVALTRSFLLTYLSTECKGESYSYTGDSKDKQEAEDMVYQAPYIIVAFSKPLVIRLYKYGKDLSETPVRSINFILNAPKRIVLYNNRILFGQHDGTLYLNEDISQFENEHTWKKYSGQNSPITALAMNNQSLFTGASNSTVMRYGPLKARKLCNMRSTITSLTLSDTHLCATSKQGLVYIFALENGSLVHQENLYAPIVGCVSDSTGFYLTTASKLTYISNDGKGFPNTAGERIAVPFDSLQISAFAQLDDRLIFGTVDGKLFTRSDKS